MSIHVGIACMLINIFGTEEQKKKYLVPLATGQHLGAFVLTEPGAGTDVMAATTTAAKRAPGAPGSATRKAPAKKAPAKKAPAKKAPAKKAPAKKADAE